jgi:hypothetical protein
MRQPGRIQSASRRDGGSWRRPAGAFAVRVVAASYGDRVFSSEPGPDRGHPRDYRELAGRVP